MQRIFGSRLVFCAPRVFVPCRDPRWTEPGELRRYGVDRENSLPVRAYSFDANGNRISFSDSQGVLDEAEAYK